MIGETFRASGGRWSMTGVIMKPISQSGDGGYVFLHSSDQGLAILC